MRPEPGTPHGNGQQLSPCTMPFLLILPQVTGQNVHQQVSIPAQPCLCWPAIHGNIYSGLYCIYIHIVCGFPLPSHSDSATVSVYPLEQLLHPLASRTVVSVWELCFQENTRLLRNLLHGHTDLDLSHGLGGPRHFFVAKDSLDIANVLCIPRIYPMDEADYYCSPTHLNTIHKSSTQCYR